jgi:ATP-dependent Clp protease ATP-binding subunit ClpB
MVFHPLTLEHVKQILGLQLRQLEGRLAERKLTLELSESAREHVALAGYDPAFGARPLKRVLQKKIQDPLAVGILEGVYPEGSTVVVDTDGKGKLTLHAEQRPSREALSES